MDPGRLLRPGGAAAKVAFDLRRLADDGVEARAAAMVAGQRAFETLFPPPRARWVDDLTLPGPTLARVDVPVLLVHGAEDRVTPLTTSALPLLEHLPDVRLHVLDRCGHVPPVEHPEEFRRLLSDFLREGEDP